MPKSFLQSKEWAEFKHRQGWRPLKIAGFFGLARDLPFGIKLLYIPELELGRPVSPSRFKRLLAEVKKIAKKEHLSFARLEFFDQFDEQDIQSIARADRLLGRAGLQKSREEMQPEYRQIIELSNTEGQLLDQMKPKGRYNIKIAQRHGVVVRKCQMSNVKCQMLLEQFYDLYREASERDGFARRSLNYFEQMATQMSDHMMIYVASWEGKQLAAALTISWQGRVSYLYGGSSSEHRNVMAANLLHWEIIKAAKRAGMKTYDLLAIAPPPPAGGPNHKFAGLRRFKQQFGGRSVRVLGSYDLIFDHARYKLFGLAEKLRGRF